MSVAVHVRRGIEGPQTWVAEDRELHDLLLSTQKSVHAALLDNFDYPMAMNHIFGEMEMPAW